MPVRADLPLGGYPAHQELRRLKKSFTSQAVETRTLRPRAYYDVLRASGSGESHGKVSSTPPGPNDVVDGPRMAGGFLSSRHIGVAGIGPPGIERWATSLGNDALTRRSSKVCAVTLNYDTRRGITTNKSQMLYLVSLILMFGTSLGKWLPQLACRLFTDALPR